MKKYTLIFISIILLASCHSPVDYVKDLNLVNKAEGHTLWHNPEFDTLDTYEKINNWILDHIVYDESKDDVKKWGNPEDTVKLGYGTCLDFAILFMNIAYYGMNQEMDLVCVEFKESRAIEAGGYVDHTVVRYNGKYIEPQTGEEVFYTGRYSLKFSDIF